MSTDMILKSSLSAAEGVGARPLRWLVLYSVLGLLCVPVFRHAALRPETPVGVDTWVLVVLSTLANVIVIAYHYLIPAHPKFLMLPWRRWILRVHIVSGTIELVAGLMACFSFAPTAARVMAIAALGFHVPTALFQTRIVFGSKAIMEPSYLLCIVTHGFCAMMLLTHPESRMWAINTFLVFNVYVWCRVYYYLFDLLKLFTTQKYTISILAAGATMIPALFGSLGLMLLVGSIGSYVLLYRALFVRSPAAYWDFVRERARESVAPSGFAADRAAGPDEPARALEFFRLLDRDGDGRLNRDELRRALAPWGLSVTALDEFASRLLVQGDVDPQRFARDVWTIGAVRNHGLRAVATEGAASERDQAALVFRHLDLDGDGVLTRKELDLLLHEWGLPQVETERYLARMASGRGEIDFEHFYKDMRPVWRYAYYEVFRAEYSGSRGDMIGRSVNAIIGARRTDALRERVKRDLITHVLFLAEAGEELIADLAATLVTENYRADQVVFEEGAPGHTFYLIASGNLRVTRDGELLAELGRGGYVGEGALLTDEPRGATVTAAGETVLLSLTRDSFSYLTEKYPAVRNHLQAAHRRRLTDGNLLVLGRRLIGRVPFLHGATDQLLADLAAALVPQRYEAQEVVVAEGQTGDLFFMIEKGAVRVSRAGETLANLGPGACFGEGVLLSTAPRAATAVALEDTRLLTLDRETFHTILLRHPDVRAAVLALHRSRNPFPLPATPAAGAVTA